MLDPVPGIAAALAATRGGDRRGRWERRAALALLSASEPAPGERVREPAPPRIVAALHAIDPLLGELFGSLWRSGAPELVAVRLGVAAATGGDAVPPRLHGALVATALFGIADALFARVAGEAADRDLAAWTPHLLAADCALAECLRALASLPGPDAERLADAFVLASGARLDRTPGSPAKRSLAERMSERTSPALALARLATRGEDRTAGAREGAVACTAWAGATVFALAEVGGGEGARARELLAAQLAGAPAPQEAERSLSTLARRIRTRAERAMAMRPAPIAEAHLAGAAGAGSARPSSPPPPTNRSRIHRSPSPAVGSRPARGGSSGGGDAR